MPAEPQYLERPKAGAITSQLGRQNAPDYLKGLNDEQRDAVLSIEFGECYTAIILVGACR